MATVTSRDFNRDVSEAKRAATVEPVVITDRGVPSHVLLSISEYRKLIADQRHIVDWLSIDDDIELPTHKTALSLAEPEW
ncbi:hypothetical protein BH23ACT6_BH23ACT6_08220 [soil metagenome]